MPDTDDRVFQSTRPRGARRYRGPLRNAAIQFQSTRPRGARLRHLGRLRGRALVSIHAPARGATGNRDGQARGDPVSIHAPARGATNPKNKSSKARSCFNPRARAGRDGQRERTLGQRDRFNPRARAGRDTRPDSGAT